jgi:membrane protein YdbS with pleckstrin-like domain
MRTTRSTARGGRVVAIVVLIWLVIGAVAAAQRGYFSTSDTNCAGVTTTLVTIVAGPLNYLGVNPQVQCPQLPQPSK